MGMGSRKKVNSQAIKRGKGGGKELNCMAISGEIVFSASLGQNRYMTQDTHTPHTPSSQLRSTLPQYY